jgi:hypothetical protein
MKKIIAVFAFILTFVSCDILRQTGLPLTELDVANGLKEALVQGVNRGSGSLFNVQANGNTGLLNELLPENAANILNIAKTLGLSPKVNALSDNLNKAAMTSVQKSVPIFINAIRTISIVDAWNILRGNPNAATAYLRNATQSSLMSAIRPEVSNVFTSLGMKTNLLGNLGSNSPLLKNLDVDLAQILSAAITQKMFAKIAQEEARIRQDVGARSTVLLQRVFGAITSGASAAPIPRKY